MGIILLILTLSTGLSQATMGYNIESSAGANSWHIDRFTGNLNFNMNEKVVGSGNFSRNNQMKGMSDMGYSERSSASRGGSLTLSDATKFISKEGPVYVTYALASSTNKSKLDEDNGSVTITIGESWPYFFTNKKAIEYSGRGIRTTETYDNQGDTITTFSDAWGLQKQTTYAAVNNRTVISAEVSNSKILVDRSSNRNSLYSLQLKAVGSLSSLDVIRKKPTDEKISISSDEPKVHISQDYRGIVEMNMKIRTKDNVPFNKCSNDTFYSSCVNEDVADYLPCCDNDYTDMDILKSQGISADCIFNCNSSSRAQFY